MTTETAAGQENIAEVVQKEVERTIQRSVRGIDVLLNRDEPDVGMTPKDVIYSRGTLRLYHYRPQSDEVYRIPVVLVMCVPSTWRSVAPITPPEPAERPTPTSEIVDPLTNRDPEDAKPRSPNRTVASTNVPDAPVPDMATPPPP